MIDGEDYLSSPIFDIPKEQAAITRMENESYNKGIDDAIRACRQEKDILHPDVQIVVVNLIKKLESLRKQ